MAPQSALLSELSFSILWKCSLKFCFQCLTTVLVQSSRMFLIPSKNNRIRFFTIIAHSPVWISIWVTFCCYDRSPWSNAVKGREFIRVDDSKRLRCYCDRGVLWQQVAGLLARTGSWQFSFWMTSMKQWEWTENGIRILSQSSSSWYTFSRKTTPPT